MDVISTIKSPIQEEFDLFRSQFLDVLKSDDELLGQVLQHIASRSGKMMRPILTLLMAKSLGPVNSYAYQGAIALELLHTASLVHDDVVDESKERRGLPSVHSIFDNKVAVLVGDYLLASSLRASAHTTLEIVNAISDLGVSLSRGEILQLSNIQTDYFSEEVYYEVIKNKTAALFASCGLIAAFSQHASSDIQERYRKFGELLGIVFQIKDDIFDYQLNAEIGKPTGNDMREGKITLPAIFALNQTEDLEKREMALKIRSLEASEEEIEQFITWVISQDGITYAENRMNEICKEALSLIEPIMNPEIYKSLYLFLNFCKDRTK